VIAAFLLFACIPHGDPCADLRLRLDAFSGTVIVGEARHRAWLGAGWFSADDVSKSFAPVTAMEGVEFLYDPVTKVHCTRFNGLHLCNMEFEGHPADTCWLE
jgi:hypothetical protein